MSDTEYAIRPNKTQLKREMRALNELGKALMALPDSNLKKIPMSEPMYEAIMEAKRLSKGALQRQLRRIASLMKQEDVESIQVELLKLTQPDRQQTAEFHQLEQWRERLLEGDDQLLSDLIDQFSDMDVQYIRQLIRNAQKEIAQGKSRKSSRSLFRYLSELKQTAANT